MSLSSLRKHLATESMLPVYKLPTLLRLVEEQEQLPTTKTGKPSKDMAKSLFSPEAYENGGKVELWDLICERIFRRRFGIGLGLGRGSRVYDRWLAI